MTIPMVMNLFRCTERTALRKLKKVRLAVGKQPNINGKSGAEPVTVEQFSEVFGLGKVLLNQ